MYLITGITVNNEGRIADVRIVSTDDDSFFRATYGQLCGAAKTPGFLFANLNTEKVMPFDGWAAYEQYDTDNNRISSPIFTMSPTLSAGKQYSCYDGNGNKTVFPGYLEMIKFAEQHKTANWYGYSMLKARPLVANETVEPGDLVFGGDAKVEKNSGKNSKNSSSDGKAERRAVNSIPKSKESKQKAEKKVEGSSFRATCIGNFDKVSEWTRNTKADTHRVTSLSAISEMNDPLEWEDRLLISAQFPENVVSFEGAKKNTMLHAIATESEDETLLFGLQSVHTDNDGIETAWTVVPEEYIHINVLSNGSYAICRTKDGEYHLWDLRKSEYISEIKGEPIRDYFGTVTASRTMTLVGTSTDSPLCCYWNVMDNKTLEPKQKISCKMEMASQVFNRSRIYRGSVAVAEFKDRTGMGIILNLKDFTYDSRMVFSREKQAEKKETAQPTWATVVVDYTSGVITFVDELGHDVLVNRFTSVTQKALEVVANWLGSTFTLPVEQQIKVRRHTEAHRISKFPNIDYNKVCDVAELLGKFESYTDLDQLMDYLRGCQSTSFEDAAKEFSDAEFAETQKGLEFKGKLFGFNFTQQGVGLNAQSYCFFRRKGTGISMISTMLLAKSEPADKAKVTFKAPNLDGLTAVLEEQTNQIEYHTLHFLECRSMGTKEGVRVVAPRQVQDIYKKSGTALHNTTTTLSLLGFRFGIGSTDKEINLYMSFCDGYKFDYKRDLKEAQSREGKTTAEFANDHNRIYNADSPMLSSSIPNAFTLEVV